MKPSPEERAREFLTEIVAFFNSNQDSKLKAVEIDLATTITKADALDFILKTESGYGIVKSPITYPIPTWLTDLSAIQNAMKEKQ